MDKKVVRLTENELKQIIQESVQTILKEGNRYDSVLEKVDELKEYIGADALISRIIARIGEDEAFHIINDIWNLEVNQYIDNE